MKKRLLFSFCFLISCSALFAKELPSEFSEELVEKLKSGQIVYEDLKNTSTTYSGKFYAFFEKVSPESFIKLVVDYPKYPDMFSQVSKGELVKTNEAKTEFFYKLYMTFEFGPFTFEFTPEGRHVVQDPNNVHKETILFNEITNYKDQIAKAEDKTRLIPFENGILIQEALDVVTKEDTFKSSKIKQQAIKYYKKVLPKLKEVLQG